MLTSPGSHHLWGIHGYRTSAYYRFMDLVGFTYGEHNPDSWEGWHWGGMHMWGFSQRLGIPEQYDLLEDALRNTELMVFWSSDPESTGGGIYTAFESTPRRYWLKELGVKMVFIDPYFNHTAELFSDKWFAPRPGTDVAMGLAIAHTWLAEDLYDKEYVASHTVGFDEWSDYVLGSSDNVPKTPEWAEGECGVPARQIRALAREWGAKRTMLAAGGKGGFGGACRSATGNEWARTMIALAAMQGLGKPGVNIWSTTQGVPCDTGFWFPGYNEGGISADTNTLSGVRLAGRLWPEGGPAPNPQHSTEGQTVSRLLIPEAMRGERLEWRGKGFCGSSIESQFQKYEYPAPGYEPCRMYYKYGGSFIGTMTETNRYVRAYREGEIEFVVNQSIWLEGEARFADIILPACTNFERWDIGEWAAPTGAGASSTDACNHRLIVFQQKCIEPLGESKPDYEIFALLAERLGIGHLYTQGLTDLDWVRRLFDASDLPRRITWEEFAEKGYYLVPVPPERERTPALRWFAEDRERDTPDLGPKPWETVGLKGLQTASGKIEFVASSLARFEKSGAGRPRAPGDGPAVHPQLGGAPHRGAHRPLPAPARQPPPAVLLPHHGRRQGVVDRRRQRPPGADRRPPLLDPAPEQRGRGGAGHRRGRPHPRLQRPRRRHPGGAGHRARPARHRALLRVRGRLPSRSGEPGHSPDTAGCINILTPKRFVTPTSTGMAPNSCLIQVEKWERIHVSPHQPPDEEEPRP